MSTIVQTIDTAVGRLEEMFDETGWYGWETQPAPELGWRETTPKVWKLDTVGSYADNEEDAAVLVPTAIIATIEDTRPIVVDAVLTGNRLLQLAYELFKEDSTPPELLLRLANTINGGRA